MEKWNSDEFLNLNIPMNLAKLNEKEFIFEEKTIVDYEYKHYIYSSSLEQNAEKKFIAEGSSPSVNMQGTVLAFWRGQSLIIMDLETGSERHMGQFRQPGNVRWSPDGSKIIFTALWEFEKRPSSLPEMTSVDWIDRLAFKSDEKGIYDGSYRQVFVLNTWDDSSQRITCSKVDFGNADFLDSHTAVCTAVKKDTDFSDFACVCRISLDSLREEWIDGPGGPVLELCVQNKHSIILLSHKNEYWEAENFKLYRLDTESGMLKQIIFPIDRSVGNYCLNDTGLKRDARAIRPVQNTEKIWINVTDGYCTRIYELEEGSIRQLTDDERVIMEFLEMDGGILQLYSSVNKPAVIEYQKDECSYEIWNENKSYEKIKNVKFDYYSCVGRRETAYCFLPQNSELKGMVLDIHGGPHFCHSVAFSIDVHLLTACGYGVVYCNPAGSQGHGEELSRASYHDWGGKDYNDLINCVNSLKKREQFTNLRWAVKGGSYGGFMVNWIIGHTDEFLCAVSERSTCNRYSQAGTSDCAFRYGKFEFDGFPWENENSYMFRSPISYVKNVNTPVLLIHGDADMNCPISQSEEFYSALRLEKKTVYFARFKGQKHSFAVNGNPKSRLERYKLLVWWLNYNFDKDEVKYE